MQTEAGVKLTKKQIKQVKQFQKLMEDWDSNLCLNVIAGRLHIMLFGDTEQNPIPESTGGFNQQNIIVSFPQGKPIADFGDW